jgi:hypothetical protein
MGLRDHEDLCLLDANFSAGTIPLKGEATMTEFLSREFATASKLPSDEQDVLAARLLEELSAENEFDRKIAGSTDKLVLLARDALEEHRAGLTEELDPDRL